MRSEELFSEGVRSLRAEGKCTRPAAEEVTILRPAVFTLLLFFAFVFVPMFFSMIRLPEYVYVCSLHRQGYRQQP